MLEARNPSYPGWAAGGHLIVTPGDETDFGAIEDDLRDFCARFEHATCIVDAQPRQVGGDRSRAAADIKHWPEGADVLGERCKGGAQPRGRRQVTDTHRDVVVGYPVIGRPNYLQIRGMLNRVRHEGRG